MPSSETAFFEKLANASTEVRSSGHLKLLGKRAAGLYTSKEASSLTEAVQNVVRDERLSRDQIRRVSETANQATWRSVFHEGGDGDAAFDPADADTVIGELAAKPQEVQDPGDMLDYSKDVPQQNLDDIDLAEMFGLEEGSPEIEALDPSTEARQNVEKTAGAVDVARMGADALVADLAVKGEELYHMVKQAHLADGHGFLQICQAVGQAMDDPSFAAETMQKIAQRLASNGVPFNQREEMEKVAHPLVINTGHPLMETAAIFEKVAKAYYSADDAHKKLVTKHREAVHYLRDKLRGV